MNATTRRNRISSHVQSPAITAAPLLSEPTKERMRKAKAQRERRRGDAAGQSAAEIELLTQQWESLRATAKAAYADADRLMDDLIRSIGVGGSVVLTDGRTVKVVDNFIDKNGQPRNVSYKPCGVKRFEIDLK